VRILLPCADPSALCGSFCAVRILLPCADDRRPPLLRSKHYTG
jgi:hypothetical protein